MMFSLLPELPHGLGTLCGPLLSRPRSGFFSFPVDADADVDVDVDDNVDLSLDQVAFHPLLLCFSC